MKKIYLDVCTLCRPFDDQNYLRIRMETDANYLIMDRIQKKQYEMIISPVHHSEVNSINDLYEKYQLLALFEKYSKMPKINLPEAKNRTIELNRKKFGLADAAHISFAEQSADVFISCDDKLIKKCRKESFKIKVYNPIEFCMEEEIK